MVMFFRMSFYPVFILEKFVVLIYKWLTILRNSNKKQFFSWFKNLCSNVKKNSRLDHSAIQVILPVAKCLRMVKTDFDQLLKVRLLESSVLRKGAWPRPSSV